MPLILLICLYNDLIPGNLLATKQYPATFQSALTDVLYPKSAHRKLRAATVHAYFKEGQKRMKRVNGVSKMSTFDNISTNQKVMRKESYFTRF